MLLLLTNLIITQTPTTSVDDIYVNARKRDPLLSVQVNDDAPVDALVISDPISIRCGARAFEYSPRDAPRLCWIRRPTGTRITLTARPPQGWGDNWHVTWQDCPQPDLRACHVPVGLEDRLIRAHFHQGSPP